MVKTKVFVGNLSFKTQERDLAKEFEQAGKVASANIITRGTRSLGYGFVEMESEEEARKDVELLNKKNIDGREINVEVAKIREESADPAGGAAAGGAARGPRGGRGGGANANAPAGTTSPGATGAASRGGRGRGGARRAPRAEGEKTEATGSPAAGGAAAGGARRPRAPRAPKAEEDKTPRTESATTLFVANLPFSVDDAGLSKIFEGLNIKAAHVVRKRNERSKGFGFVEFNNAEDQQKALSVNNKEVEGRQLIVKVALTELAGTNTPAAPEAQK